MDKTASFVARNGPEFEARIRQNELGNPKFNFLNSGDPYHAYYQHKVKEIREGKGMTIFISDENFMEWILLTHCKETSGTASPYLVSKAGGLHNESLESFVPFVFLAGLPHTARQTIPLAIKET